MKNGGFPLVLIDALLDFLYNREMKPLMVIGVLASEIIIIVGVESLLIPTAITIAKLILIVSVPLVFVVYDIWALLRWISSGK